MEITLNSITFVLFIDLKIAKQKMRDFLLCICNNKPMVKGQ
jgi:hypothetical protein